MGSTNKKLRGKLEDCVSAMRAAREAIAIARRYVPPEWKKTMINAIEYLTEQISNNKMNTCNSGVDKDDDELPKHEYKMADNVKHFEPVTARSLAEKAYEIIMTSKVPVIGWKERVTETIEKLLEPHIRKPSDGMMADVGWVTGGMKSVPARCEEAYNEALKLIESMSRILGNTSSFYDTSLTLKRFLEKPNPFHEADIMHEYETEPTLLPFSLEEAQNGAKVVTRKGIPAKIVADDLANDEIAFIVQKENGKHLIKVQKDGLYNAPYEDEDDLFILKEPEDIDIYLFRHNDGTYYAQAPGQAFYQPNTDYKHIKTIRTTI